MTSTASLSRMVSLALMILIILTPLFRPQAIIVAQINDGLVPLSLHDWNSLQSFALLDIDSTGLQTISTVQLITNELNEVNSTNLPGTIVDFIKNKDLDPSRTLITYSTWHNITSPRITTNRQPYTNFYVTTTFPFLRTMDYQAPFPNLPSLNLSYYTMGIPTILSAFKDINDQLWIFKMSFLGLAMKYYNITRNVDNSVQGTTMEYMTSYLLTDVNMLQLIGEALAEVPGVTIPNITSVIPAISIQKENSITYVINNPILIFQKEIPEEIIPTTNIFYPSSPNMILFSDNLSLTFSFEPFFSPLGAHLSVKIEVKLDPIEWMLIRENVSVQDFSNISRVYLPPLGPLVDTNSRYLEFFLYHEKKDLERRLSQTSYPKIELSYVLDLQAFSISKITNSPTFDVISPSIDNEQLQWEPNTSNYSISKNISFTDEKNDASRMVVLLPVVDDALQFNKGFLSSSSTFKPLIVDKALAARWRMLNADVFTVWNIEKNNYYLYYAENQINYLTESIVSMLSASFDDGVSSTLTRDSISENLLSTTLSQTLLDVTIEGWNGSGIIHQMLGDVIQEYNGTFTDLVINRSTMTINANNIIPSFQFIFTFSSIMFLAVMYLIQRKKHQQR